jgi:hypothetical protein
LDSKNSSAGCSGSSPTETNEAVQIKQIKKDDLVRSASGAILRTQIDRDEIICMEDV